MSKALNYAIIINKRLCGCRKITNENKEPSDDTGAFTGFVFLADTVWDKKQLITDIQEKWSFSAADEEKDDTLIFFLDGMFAAVSLIPTPIPKGEAEQNAAGNYMWRDAVNVTKPRKAHIMVAVQGKVM